MAEKDFTEKSLEALNDVFADIVNGLLFRGEQVLNEENLIDAQPFSVYDADGKPHEQERDVAKYWVTEKGERINVRIALLGIENQTRYDKDMALRAISYDGAAYRAQLAQEERYPVITLVLYFGDRPWGKNRTLRDAVKIPKKLEPYVNDYRLNLFEIAFLPAEAVSWFHSDFKIVADYFIGKRNNPEYRPKDPIKFRHANELLRLMSALTNDSRYQEALKLPEGSVENMCEVLDYWVAKGKAEGIEEGRAEGKTEGIAEGIVKGIAEGRTAEFKKNIETLAGNLMLKDPLLTHEKALEEAKALLRG